MGLWDYELEAMLYGYDAELWEIYPKPIVQAFFAISYDDSPPVTGPPYPWPRDEVELVSEAIEAFSQRRGGLSDEIFLRTLQEAHGRDRLVSIFALGYNRSFPAEEVLFPFLASHDLLERCATAIVLGLRHDERVVPVLEEYLLTDVPLIEVPLSQSSTPRWRVQPEAELWFSTYRVRIAGLVANWGPASMNDVIQKAFLKYWQEEQTKLQPAYTLPDGLMYALGRRRVIKVLKEISLPEFHQRLATIYFALGLMGANERFENLNIEMAINKELKREVVVTCVEQLGLSEQEAQFYVSLYSSDSLKRRKKK